MDTNDTMYRVLTNYPDYPDSNAHRVFCFASKDNADKVAQIIRQDIKERKEDCDLVVKVIEYFLNEQV